MTLEEYFINLYKSENEYELSMWLSKIIKNFNSSLYKEELKNNVLFCSIINDIKGEIILDMKLMVEHMKNEINLMDDKLLNLTDHSEFLLLKNVRRELIYLLNGLENRLHSVYLL